MQLYELIDKLKAVIPSDRIYTDYFRRLAYGTDASLYRLIPKLVVKVKNEDEVTFLLKECHQKNIPVTFRAAGTSLSGQALTDSVLVLLDRDWKGYKITEDADRITLQPALIGAYANLYLKPFNKKIGPDPASINSAMIGGIAANNASGMCCGTSNNSYNTLLGMKIIFNDGYCLNTQDDSSIEKFKVEKKELIDSILKLKKEITEDDELVSLIKNKYKLKNTTGYSINSFVDFDEPIDTIQHLMIGSEGTLGFISEITYKTIPENPFKASALIIFSDIKEACSSLPELKKSPVDAVELMDRASIRSVENKKGMPGFLNELNDDCAALLIETSSISKDLLKENIESITSVLNKFNLIREVEFTDKPEEYSILWNIRKGLFPSVGAMRKSGTTVVIEDVAYPIDKLADATLELQSLFKKYGYDEAIIFGHALEGNLHFVFHQDFSQKEEVERYGKLMNDVIEMTASKYRGSLKAEHGTGRNMAPFVKYEWGEKAFEIMQRIKKIFDPENILNPGVIINEDKDVYLKNFKPMPKAHDIIDKCIECGFCENVCPSKDLTLSPRHRIVLLRELASKKVDSNTLKSFYSQLKYDVNDTCATDSLCKLKCPVEIDTGEIVKLIRSEEKTEFQKFLATVLSRHFSVTSTLLRGGLNIANALRSLIGLKAARKLTLSIRNNFSINIPVVNNNFPEANSLPGNAINFMRSENKVVYFSSCINRNMKHHSSQDEPLDIKFTKILNSAGYEVIFPAKQNELCCGMPFSSKGYFKQADYKSTELLDSLLNASDNGKYPIVFDTSPCTKRVKEFLNNRTENLSLFDSVEFINRHVLDKLQIKKIEKPVIIHPVCSLEHMGLTNDLIQIAERCSAKVIVPEDVSCCGFAGDRGFTYPELNASALKNLKRHVHNNNLNGYSTSTTCEIGLREHSGIEYKSIIYLVHEAMESTTAIRH
ncbi:MAG: FAD-binding oxidoreductase [Ignavibacteria bacterium]|nr:MAG: FAD-binding oxidoreductase [Ignavibacteria bacterium]